MEENANTINFKWLENIYEQLKNIQEMERLAIEGCNSLADYIQMPYEMRNILLADIQYKNIRFVVFEMNSLITNLSPYLKDKTDYYKNQIGIVLKNIDNRNLFMKEIKKNDEIVFVELLPFAKITIKFLLNIKLEIIKEIGDLLYVTMEEKKKTW